MNQEKRETENNRRISYKRQLMLFSSNSSWRRSPAQRKMHMIIDLFFLFCFCSPLRNLLFSLPVLYYMFLTAGTCVVFILAISLVLWDGRLMGERRALQNGDDAAGIYCCRDGFWLWALRLWLDSFSFFEIWIWLSNVQHGADPWYYRPTLHANSCCITI